MAINVRFHLIPFILMQCLFSVHLTLPFALRRRGTSTRKNYPPATLVI